MRRAICDLSSRKDIVRVAPGHQGRLKSLNLREFTGLIFEACPGLAPWKESVGSIYEAFNQYKREVPVCGAIMLNPDKTKCLLVRGWKKQATWGFPRGKLASGETEEECAIREVLEETGYDIASKLRPEWSLVATIDRQATRMYIIPDVPEDTPFAPTVRYEIGAFAWYHVAQLPDTREANAAFLAGEDGSKFRFFNVWIYMKQVKTWINSDLAGIYHGNRSHEV
ncbi:hypothetical protein H632_c226p2 [Helicosporidium sp. ATCC 50920]|nr:hypothetical protein H632_c226p2 [Helicosporidium sp. ATCC 50920]|eukprot:KDD76438.1 hypothetical protein H632_c226p2 [Helicosporidium sp. ATCC 50920]